MSTRLQAQVKTTSAPTPTFTPVQTGLLQRKCACGGSSSLTGQCEECGKKRLTLLRRATDHNKPATVPPIVHDVLRSPGQPLDSTTRAFMESRFGHDFRRIGIQPKLTVSAPDDKYEREADMVADAVTHTSTLLVHRKMLNGEKRQESLQTKKFSGQNTPLIQRQAEEERKTEDAAEGEEPTEEKLEEMEESNVAPLAQRKAQPSRDALTGDGQAALQEVFDQRFAGNPLDSGTRHFMESRFGYDFSGVRIHADEQAHKAARAINARAFTVGQNIWFARGEFSPSTPSGRHLLAHELAHTVQQRGHSSSDIERTIQRSICPSSCEASVSAGNLCRARRVTRDSCGTSAAVDPSNKISHIRVTLGDRKVALFWNGTPDTETGTSEEFDCTPNPSRTPKGKDTVGTKCGINHTSYKRYNMAWFTAVASTGMRIGFHNSQPLGAGYRSHGCVRVSCEDAEKINKNSQSGWTSIEVK